MNRRTWWRGPAWAALFLAASGCGSGLYQAGGRLTHKGKPVSSTVVIFQPDDPGQRASRGLTDDDGRFSLTHSRSETGVLPGKHTVLLKYYVSAEEELGEIKPKEPAAVRKLISGKYADVDKSPLKCEVSSNGQFFELEMED